MTVRKIVREYMFLFSFLNQFIRSLKASFNLGGTTENKKTLNILRNY